MITTARNSTGRSPAQPILRGVGLKKAYGNHKLFEAVDIDLFPGEITLLRGENGAGKTALLDILSGNLAADRGKLEIGTGETGPQEISAALGSPTRLARLGVVKCGQRPELFWSFTVRENLEIAARGSADSVLSWRSANRTVGTVGTSSFLSLADFVERLQLDSLLDRRASALSFGQTRRVSLAMSALVGHRALLLDEPMASLDHDGAASLASLLGTLTSELGRSVLLVEHLVNERLLSNLRYRILELRSGQLNEVEYQPPDHRSDLSQIRYWTDLIETTTRLRRTGTLQQLGTGGSLLRFQGPDPQMQSSPILVADRLRVERPHRMIFGSSGETAEEAGISLSLRTGEIAVLLARNGWGKTSFAQALSGELGLAAGMLRFDNQAMADLAPWLRRHLGIVYSETAARLFGNLSIKDIGLMRLGKVFASPPGISPHQKIRTLSGGERQRLALSLALESPGARLLLLDEPFNGLDAKAVRFWLKRLESAAAENKAVLLCLPA